MVLAVGADHIGQRAVQCSSASPFDSSDSKRINTLPRRSASKLRAEQQTGAMYLGDLDPSDVRILIGVNRRRQEDGQPTLQPHSGLYRWLLAHGRPRPLEKAPTDELVRSLRDAFAADLANALIALWSGGQRIPQESFGVEQLRGNQAAIAAPDAA